MKAKSISGYRGFLGAAVLVSSALLLQACGDSGDVPTSASQSDATLEKLAAAGEILPYYIVFNAEGAPEIRGVDVEGGGVRIVDVKNDEFPIKAKIKKVETITFVTYEGSCEILTPTPTGYKKIIIQNDAICAKIKP